MNNINLTDLPALISRMLAAQEEIRTQLHAINKRLDAADAKIADGAAQLSACHSEMATRVINVQAHVTRLDREGSRSNNDTRMRVVQLEKDLNNIPDMIDALVELSSSVEALEVHQARQLRAARELLGAEAQPAQEAQPKPRPDILRAGRVGNPALFEAGPN